MVNTIVHSQLLFCTTLVIILEIVIFLKSFVNIVRLSSNIRDSKSVSVEWGKPYSGDETLQSCVQSRIGGGVGCTLR